MIGRKQFFSVILIIMLTTLFLVVAFVDKDIAFASEENFYHNAQINGLTSAQIYLLHNNGLVQAELRINSLLFANQVCVYLYLYYSDTYTEDYTQMTLAVSNYTSGLTAGQSAIINYVVNGQQRYWRAVASYKDNSSNTWKEKQSATLLFDAYGVLIS